MKELSIRCAYRHFNERTTSMIQLKERFSIMVHRFNSNMIISRHQGIPEGSSHVKVNEKLSFCLLNETGRSSLMKRKAPTLTTPAFENDIGPRVGCGKKHRFEIVEERANEDDDCCTTTSGIRTTPPQQSLTNPTSPIPLSGTTPLVTLPCSDQKPGDTSVSNVIFNNHVTWASAAQQMSVITDQSTSLVSPSSYPYNLTNPAGTIPPQEQRRS